MMTKFLTLELAIEFYHLVKNYKFHNRVMQDQFNRALLSIPLNLSEGSGKPTHKDRRKFYFTSYASLREIEVLFRLQGEEKFKDQIDRLAAYIWKVAQRTGGA